MTDWCVCWSRHTNSMIACTQAAMVEINNLRLMDDQAPLAPVRVGLSRDDAERFKSGFQPFLEARAQAAHEKSKAA